jgi:hypothetical protein
VAVRKKRPLNPLQRFRRLIECRSSPEGLADLRHEKKQSWQHVTPKMIT